jgi:hypothetical protein
MTAKRGATIIYVGPSLAAAEVRARMPDADVRPPAGMGDVIACARERGRGGKRIARIAIIDGYFERMAAVWHKEILFALERGIAVWGAASMGALRAAELAPFGMVGVGDIYRAFARGAMARDTTPAAVTARGSILPPLTCDDEVAVAHLPASHDYRAVSDALVNLRDGLARAARAGAIRLATATTLVELARRRFYRDRSWAQLDTDARAAGIATRELAALATWLSSTNPDRKAADARLLLARLLGDSLLTRPPPVRVPRTWAFRRL